MMGCAHRKRDVGWSTLVCSQHAPHGLNAPAHLRRRRLDLPHLACASPGVNHEADDEACNVTAAVLVVFDVEACVHFVLDQHQTGWDAGC